MHYIKKKRKENQDRTRTIATAKTHSRKWLLALTILESVGLMLCKCANTGHPPICLSSVMGIDKS
jgi:hypothetical protein